MEKRQMPDEGDRDRIREHVSDESRFLLKEHETIKVSIVSAGGLKGYYGRVVGVRPDSARVDVPEELHSYLRRHPGVRVMVSAYRVRGVYCFVSDEAGAQEDGSLALVIPLPESVKRLQQRKYMRYNERIMVDYRIESEPQDAAVETIMPGEGRLWTHDISAGGLCLISPAEIVQGTVLSLRIGFQGGVTVAATAKVVHVRRGTDGGYTLGMQFESISPRDRGYIEQYVQLNTQD